MASFSASSKSIRKNGDGADLTAIHAQEREGKRGGNLNGRAGKMTQDELPPKMC